MSEPEMDMDEGDDLYEPEETTVPVEKVEERKPTPKQMEELEEGEEEDESGAMDEDDSDSDVDIITERKDSAKPAPPPQQKYSDIRNIPQRTASAETSVKPAPAKKEPESRRASGRAKVATPSADQTSAATSKSKVDIHANPVYSPAGKPITQVNIDEDLTDNEKPWRKPGTDISDYFNYGFDEFTWALYAAKQESVRGEFGAEAFASNNKKMMDDFNNMMMMGGMGLPGASGSSGPNGMPGADGMSPEMQAVMQQMMASGMDMSQMDPSQMSAMFAGMQNGAAPGGAQGPPGQNFGGGGGGGGFGGAQPGFGYDPGMAAGGGGSGRGGFGGGGGGGGRGRRGRW